MRWLLAVAVIVGLAPAFATSVNPPPSLQTELSRLESRKWAPKFPIEDRKRLGDLYFLLSRCPDVKILSLKAIPTDASCWCGGECPKGSELKDVVKLRTLLEGKGAKKPTSLADPAIKTLWARLRSRPDASYLVYRFLTHSNAVNAALRSELEKDLAALEVHQK